MTFAKGKASESKFDLKTGKALCESLLLSICILSFLGR